MRVEKGSRWNPREKKKNRPVSTPKHSLTLLWGAAALCLLCFLSIGLKLYSSRRQAQKIAAEHENSSVLQGNQPQGGQELIEWKGKRYRRNTAIRAILCIGVDSKGEMEYHQASGQAGQADGLFLVAQDMARDTVKVLLVPRDTMTEITLYDLMGNELGRDTQHLTLAFAYGDGREKSCELLRDAVSRLLFGLHIDGYLAMNISSISALNDEVGGVTVTVRTEGLETRDPALAKGNTVHLNGNQAEIFVRYRDITQAQTAISRMDRQKEYMQAYLAAAKEAAREDDGLITRLTKRVQEHMITDMPKDQYLDMGLAVLNSGQQLGDSDFVTVPGEAVETDRFDEFHPDQEGLMELVVKLFYKEIP